MTQGAFVAGGYGARPRTQDRAAQRGRAAHASFRKGLSQSYSAARTEGGVRRRIWLSGRSEAQQAVAVPPAAASAAASASDPTGTSRKSAPSATPRRAPARL